MAQVIGTVKEIIGTVKAISQTGVIRILSKGDVIYENETVEAMVSSQATIDLTIGKEIVIEGDSLHVMSEEYINTFDVESSTPDTQTTVADIENLLDTDTEAPAFGQNATPNGGLGAAYYHDRLEFPEDNYELGGTAFVNEEVIDDVEGAPENQIPTANITVNPENDTPTIEAVIPATNFNEDASTTIDLAAAFDDVETADGDLTFSVSGNTNIAVSIVNGVATLSNATADWNGTENITFTVTDAGGLQTTQTVAITVAPVADIADDTQNVTEDTATIINVLGNDTFENAGAVVTAVGAATHGSVALVGGVVTYTPDENYNGPDSFTYTVTSGGVTETATANITVNPENDTPTIEAVIPATNFNEDASTTIDLAAAFDDVETADGDLTFSVSGNTNIAVSIVNGVATLSNATADWNGTENITFTVTDAGGLQTTQTVAITVAPVADIADDTQNVTEDTATIINVLGNDTFENAGAVVTAVGAATHGSVALVGGVVTYTPDENYNGPDSFTYTVTSGGVTETATANITVNPENDTPTIEAVIPATNFNEDASTTIDLAAAFDDVETADGDLTFSVSGNTNIAVSIVNGVATLSNATADWNGTENITFTVTDAGGLQTTQTVAITVAPVADIADDTQNVTEDTATIINVLGNDTFENAGAVVTAVGAATHGSVALVGGVVTYTPDENYNGPDSFTYTVTSGGVTETATANITVNPENDTPTIEAVIPATNFNEDASTTIDLAAAFDDVETADGDLTFSVSGNTNIAVSIVNGVATLSNATADWNGTENITFTVTDAGGLQTTQTVAITVAPVADIADDTQNVTEDTATIINVLGNDTFENAGAVVTAVGAATHGSVALVGGVVTYTPDENYNGPDSFTYTVTSGGVTETATANITVNPENDTPTIDQASYSFDYNENSLETVILGTVSATDVDGDILSYSITAGNDEGYFEINSNGEISLTVAGAEAFTNDYELASNIHNLTVQVSDPDGELDTVSVTLNEQNVNESPVALDDGNNTINTNLGLVGEYFGISSEDVSDDPSETYYIDSIADFRSIIASKTADATFIGSSIYYGYGDGSVSLNQNLEGFLNSDASSLQWVDNSNHDEGGIHLTGSIYLEAGEYSFNVLGDDGYEILIDGVQVAAADRNQSPTENNFIYTIATDGYYSIDMIWWDQGGEYVFQPSFSKDGGDYQYIDSSILVQETNIDSLFGTSVDQELVIDVDDLLSNDIDPDGDTLSIVSVGGAVNGTVTLNANGTITFIPDAGYSGEASFTYTIEDEFGNAGIEYNGDGTASATVTLYVHPIPSVVDATPKISTTDNEVEESGLVDGNDWAGDEYAYGVFTVTSGDGIQSISIEGTPLSFSAIQALTLNDSTTHVSINTSYGVITLTDYDESTGNINYTYKLSSTQDHSAGDVIDQIDISVTDTDGDTTNSSFDITVGDDVPSASPQDVTITIAPVTTNVIFVLDMSGSMSSNALALQEETRDAVIQQYQELGSVNVMQVEFASSAYNSGWQDADTILNSATDTHDVGNMTDYEAALNSVMNNYDTNRPNADQTIVYFISDGDITEGSTTNWISSWETFISQESITKLFTFGIEVVSDDLTAVALPSETVKSPDYVTVTNVANLPDTVSQTVALYAEGNLTQAADGTTIIDFGADGGHIASITIGSITVNYDASNPLQVVQGTYGEFEINFETGAYRYLPTTNVAYTEVIQASIIDNDGDTIDTVLLNIHIDFDSSFNTFEASIADTFDTNTDGWTNSFYDQSALHINGGQTASKTFLVDSNETVELSFKADSQSDWEGNDYLRVYVNGTEVLTHQNDINGVQTFSFDATANSSGELNVSIFVNTNWSGESVLIDDFTLTRDYDFNNMIDYSTNTFTILDEMVLDFDTITNVPDAYNNINTIELSSTNSQDITLDIQDVLDVTDSNNELIINGESSDSVTLEGTWISQGNTNGFNIYTATADSGENLTIKIEDDITNITVS